MPKIVVQSCIICMRYFSKHSGMAPRCSLSGSEGFTLVELIVVITIMVAMMALAASMLRGGGRGQGLQAAVEMVDGMVQEARLDAMGKGTWSRLIIVSTPDDEARNMRTLGVMSKNTRTGKWHLVNRLQTLPAGFYVSPAYSTLLEGSKKARGEKSTARGFASRDGQDTVNLPGNRMTDIYFIEFDEEGRMSQPNAPTRLVVVAGSAGNGKEERPTPMVDGKPGLAGGIVIYPKGNISRLRTTEQVIPN